MPKPTVQPAQKLVFIDQIHDDVVILKDGSMRAVLMTSSLNFGLKSEEEQAATIFQFQNFLNSLDYSIQILIQSRKLKIDDYVKTVKEFGEKQTNELLRVQTMEYADFIKNLVEAGNIMTKSFYLIVPYSPPALSAKKAGGFLSGLLGKAKKPEKAELMEKFMENKIQLWQRLENVKMGLSTFGIRSKALTTAELIELFYTMYNPAEAEMGVIPKL